MVPNMNVTMKLRAYFSLLRVERELGKNLCPVPCHLPVRPLFTRILSSKCSRHCLATLALPRALATQGWQILQITERATATGYLYVISEASYQASISLQDAQSHCNGGVSGEGRVLRSNHVIKSQHLIRIICPMWRPWTHHSSCWVEECGLLCTV